MRNFRLTDPVLATIFATCFAASCAGAGAASPPTPAPATADAAPVVQIHDVRDLVTPPGETSPDTDRTERLAGELRESVTFVGGSASDAVEITALGGDLIVRAPRGVQAQIRAALLRRRAIVGAAPR